MDADRIAAGGEPVGSPRADGVSATSLGAVHFIGIGGAGMSGIARILLARGHSVSGSDVKDSRTLAALRALGATVHVGHAADHVAVADTVVASSAIRASNPELVAARDADLRILPRAAALAAVMTDRQGIAIAGTHGKTTTTSMLTVALQRCGADPSFVIGGDLNEAGSGAHHGSGELFVAEADESDGSFLLLAPYAAVVTNVESDHVDHYSDETAVHAAFSAFAGQIDRDGFLVACADDPGALRVADAARAAGLATSPMAFLRRRPTCASTTLRARRPRDQVQVVQQGRRLGEVHLVVPGWHNAANATAAIAAGLALGFPFSEFVAGLATFTGARRRFELKGVAGGVRVYDDYAHHPTELRAVPSRPAAAAAAGGGLSSRSSRTATRGLGGLAAGSGAALGLGEPTRSS